MSAKEKVAYLKGLIDGQNLADSPDKAKFYKALVEALESLAVAIEEHEDVHDELKACIASLDEDLDDFDERLLECENSLNEDDKEDEDSEESDFEDFDEEEYESVTCPNCHNDFYFEPAQYDDDEDLICPHCGKPFKRPEV